jgi:5'-nucleotidase (lipoprotein e(P4) family)
MKTYHLIIALFLILGCKTSQFSSRSEQTALPVREHSVQSVLWQQQAAEYKALCYQAFNLAKMQLDKTTQQLTMDNRPLAIITDIDETVLDNSPYNAKMIATDQEYSKADWIEWGQLRNAQPVPGALEFFTYAKSKGVEIFYISNRYAIQQQETLANLAQLGFPDADSAHILLRTTTSGKEERRKTVTQEHRVLLLLGDNLSDFDQVFDKKQTDERNALAEEMKQKFGTAFIVLPNPMYGDWETKGHLPRKLQLDSCSERLHSQSNAKKLLADTITKSPHHPLTVIK